MKLKDRVNGMSAEDFYPSREEIINSPQHYTVGGYEAIDVIKAKLTPEEWRGYCKGNVLKYIMRANYKEHHDTDIGKALWYMKELDDALESKEVTAPIHWSDAEQVRENDSDEPPF